VADNRRILFISDTHAPYAHPDAWKFLDALKSKHKPTRIIHLGDEIDGHAISFHDHDPDLASPGYELKAAVKQLSGLYSIFPEAEVLWSNHGSLWLRRAFKAGLPANVMKSYEQILSAPPKWSWHKELVINLGGQLLYAFHGKSSNGLAASQKIGASIVQGHFHTSFSIQKWRAIDQVRWSMICGCLIDLESAAFKYQESNILKPIIGTGLVIDGAPVLELMRQTRGGRWTGSLSK
jgi:hypothetical protein